MKYSFDTSAFVVPFRHWPGPDLMPSLWNMLEAMVARGEIVASTEVRVEIAEKDDELLKWVDDRLGLFQEVDEEQQVIVRRIVNRFPDWIDPDTQSNDADPYVIALAMKYEIAVVSNERNGGKNNPKIPYVCDVLGVKHLSLRDFLKEVSWKG